MMKQKTIIGMIVLLLLLVAHTSMALRCGNLFVKPGVSSSEIMLNCGEPVLKESLGFYGRSGDIKERWTYGPHEGGWYYFLYFRAGVLDKVESKKNR
jgi:hypothetical protein